MHHSSVKGSLGYPVEVRPSFILKRIALNVCSCISGQMWNKSHEIRRLFLVYCFKQVKDVWLLMIFCPSPPITLHAPPLPWNCSDGIIFFSQSEFFLCMLKTHHLYLRLTLFSELTSNTFTPEFSAASSLPPVDVSNISHCLGLCLFQLCC